MPGIRVRPVSDGCTSCVRRLDHRGVLTAHDTALDDLGATDSRLVVIGATEHGADVMLPGLTAALRDALPDWRVRFRLDRNVSLADAIDRGLVDVAVMLDGSGLDRKNASGIVELTWISSRTFSAPGGEPLPLVIFAEPCTLREPAFSTLDKLEVAYTVAAECADLAGLYAAVRSGLGVALLPVIGRLPDGVCLAEGIPAANRASVFVAVAPESTPTSCRPSTMRCVTCSPPKAEKMDKRCATP